MRRVLPLVFAALGLIMTGIAAAADSTAVPGITKDTILIGVPEPFSGPLSTFGAAGYGIEAYYNYINAQGGIHGRKIKVVFGDAACDPARGVAVTKRLIYQENVFLINGISCSAVGLALRPVIAATNVPFVIGTASNQHISAPVVHNIFQAVQTAHDFGAEMANFALSKPGAKRIAIVEHSNEWAKGYADTVVEILKKHGLKPVADVRLERGATDATAQVLRLKEIKPDFIISILYGPESAVFIKAANKFGLDVPMIGALGADYLETQNRVGGPADMKNFYMVHQYRGLLNTPDLAKFQGIIAKYIQKGQKITDFTFYGPGSAVVVAHVLQEIGPNPTREKFNDAMEKVKDFNTGILAGKMTFSPQDHQGVHTVYVVGYDKAGDRAVFESWGKKANLD